MVPKTLYISLAFSLFACGGGSGNGSPDGGGGGNDGNGLGEFQSFTPIVFAENSGTISVTSAAGIIGCSLADTLAAIPGGGTEQIFLDTNLSRFSDDTDPIVAAGCQIFETRISNGCALYRRWSMTGELEAAVFATGGAIATTRLGDNASKLEIELIFPGGKTFSTSFTRNDQVDCNQ